MSENELQGFAPPDFFWQEELDCYAIESELSKALGKKHELADLAGFFGEECFAKVSIGWQSSGLSFQVAVELDSIKVNYPDIAKGDSLELFIDTRDVKSARSVSRFCHHFFFLPEKFEGHDRGEITRFRSDDSHPLCQDESLELKVKKQATGYLMSIFIPQECLVGYDPANFQRLGFTYRINRSDGLKQHFALNSEHAKIESLPHLWASLKLVD